MHKVIWSIDGIDYSLGHGLGVWAKSIEGTFLKLGTTRLIKGELMHVYNRNRQGWFSYEYCWCPVNPFNSDWAKMQAWALKGD